MKTILLGVATVLLAGTAWADPVAATIELVNVPGGCFLMGTQLGEKHEQPVHKVCVSAFQIGKFEVTQAQWRAAMGANPARFSACGDNCPVEQVSWSDVQAFLAKLASENAGVFRLPTEAEWEYAARADTSTAYSFGDDETAACGYARFADLSSRLGWGGGCRGDTVAYGPLPVGSLKPNSWGIFDMHGNAWEWAEDCWTPIASEIPTDGSAFSRPGSCEVGVIRGGSWAAGYPKVRSATRWPAKATSHNHNVGFRVALSVGE